MIPTFQRLVWLAIAAGAMGLGPSFAQQVELPSALRPSVVDPEIEDRNRLARQQDMRVVPLPPVGRDGERMALAPYGYGSGYPAPIAESADEAVGLRPDPLFSGPSILPEGSEPIVTPEGVVLIPGEAPLEAPPSPKLASQGSPSGARKGFLQQVSLMTTYLPKFGEDGLGMTSFENSVVLGMPFPTVDSPLVITPGFDFHLVDGPSQTDLPPRLYDTYLQLRWLRKLSDSWAITLAATPGYYTDFEGDNSDAVRVTAQALAIWSWTPESKLIFGVVYLDRDDVNVLPAGGLIWVPNEETRLEVIFPRPRFLRRYAKGTYFEDWWFIGGQFGGGQWAIERASGEYDVATLRDYRVSVGIERKSIDYFVGGRLEAGYVFGRAIEYRSGVGDFDPSDTMFVRAGLFY